MDASPASYSERVRIRPRLFDADDIEAFCGAGLHFA